MVSFTDLKAYSSQSGLGGSIDTDLLISSAAPNNLISGITRDELISGTTRYACFYFKNTSAENMDKFTLWNEGTPLAGTAFEWGFDDSANPYKGAIFLDGIDEYVNCGNHANLWSKSLSKFSFSFWIKPSSIGDGFYRGIIDHGNGANHSFACYIDNDEPGRIVFKIVDSLGDFHLVGCDNLIEGIWQHIICSYDPSHTTNKMRIYLNGVQNIDFTDNHEFTGSLNISADLLIGNASNDYHGTFRDFKFWDNSSINSTEAEDLYLDNGDFNTEPSYHLAFSERSGTPTDKVSGTKTATFVNGADWRVSAISIADKYSAPSNVTWYHSGSRPPSIGRLSPGESVPIWCKLTVDPDPEAQSYLNDNNIWTVRFDVSTSTGGTGSGGTPGTGGGTGGNPTTTTNYKVCFAGDWGCESETNDVIDLIKDQDYDLIVGVGDNAYESASCWTSRFNFARNKMISAYGNHEYEESGGTGPYKTFFGDSSSSTRGGIVYTFRWQNILFLIMDTNDDKGGVSLDNQRTYFRNELEKYKNDSKVTWRIAVCHHPWFGDGGKHSENEFNQIQKFHKLFTDYRVSFVYTGHNHNWHRSHQVGYDSGTPKTPNIVDSSSPYSRNVAGLMQINTGTGGHDGPGDFYDLPDDASFWAYRNKSNNGVHELVASNNGNTLTGKFRNTSGSSFDTFVINA